MLGVALTVLSSACGTRLIGGADTDETTTDAPTTDPTDTSSTDPTDTDPTATDPTDTDPTDPTNPTSSTDFVPDSDTNYPESCDPFSQDCPEGEKCVPWSNEGGSWDDTKCVPIIGDQMVGEPCTYDGSMLATDDCDGSGMCWNVDQDGNGTCHSFCTGTPDNPMCPEKSSCLISGDATIVLCVPNCDPIVQDCNEGLGCFWDGWGFSCIFTIPESIPSGQPCGYINDCAPGNLCTDASALPACEGSACCSPFCDLGLDPVPCEALPGTSCVPFWEEGMAPAGYEHVGICIVP